MGQTKNRSVKVAAVQSDPKILEKSTNLDNICQHIHAAADNGAKLVVFTECALTGYLFKSWSEAESVSEEVPGPSTRRIAEEAKRRGVYVVVGLVEKDGETLYNTAVLVGPEERKDGLVGIHRKVHIYWGPEYPWVTVGDTPFNVFATDVGRIGMMICGDFLFPEAARCLAFNGADIICLPTNVPTIFYPYDFWVKTRCAENHVFMIASDRVGIERGTPFAGHSMIVDVNGKIVAEASGGEGAEEEIIYATIDPARARSKLLIEGDERSDLWWRWRHETPVYINRIL